MGLAVRRLRRRRAPDGEPLTCGGRGRGRVLVLVLALARRGRHQLGLEQAPEPLYPRRRSACTKRNPKVERPGEPRVPPSRAAVERTPPHGGAQTHLVRDVDQRGRDDRVLGRLPRARPERDSRTERADNHRSESLQRALELAPSARERRTRRNEASREERTGWERARGRPRARRTVRFVPRRARIEDLGGDRNPERSTHRGARRVGGQHGPNQFLQRRAAWARRRRAGLGKRDFDSKPLIKLLLPHALTWERPRRNRPASEPTQVGRWVPSQAPGQGVDGPSDPSRQSRKECSCDRNRTRGGTKEKEKEKERGRRRRKRRG